MKLSVHARLAYNFAQPTEVMAIVQVARSADQTIIGEALQAPPELVESFEPASGARLLRGTLSGPVVLDYRATVDNGQRALLSADILEHPWAELPVEVLPYLLQSRYCPVDRFLRFTAREFGTLTGGTKALAILDWINTHVDYVHGVSTSGTTATDTFLDRAGVCRDFTHLGITLCRAAGLPARAVAAYALNLEPADFHAIFEIWLGGRWWLVDATRLAPIEGLVRIAEGRDAADIAFMTTRGPCNQTDMTIAVSIAD